MKDPDVETVGEPARASYIRTLALPATAKRFSAIMIMNIAASELWVTVWRRQRDRQLAVEPLAVEP